jgi:hypothetical protein
LAYESPFETGKCERFSATIKVQLARTFEWTPALRKAVDMALAARRIEIAPWLFCAKRGEGYFDELSGPSHRMGFNMASIYDPTPRRDQDQESIYGA